MKNKVKMEKIKEIFTIQTKYEVASSLTRKPITKYKFY